MTNITAPTLYRPWLEEEIARLNQEINEMQREIGILLEGPKDRENDREIMILLEGLNDREIERSDLLDQLGWC